MNQALKAPNRQDLMLQICFLPFTASLLFLSQTKTEASAFITESKINTCLSIVHLVYISVCMH